MTTLVEILVAVTYEAIMFTALILYAWYTDKTPVKEES